MSAAPCPWPDGLPIGREFGPTSRPEITTHRYRQPLSQRLKVVAAIILAHAASLLAGNALIGSAINIERISPPMIIAVPLEIATASRESAGPVAPVAEPEEPGTSNRQVVEEVTAPPPLAPLADKIYPPPKPVAKKTTSPSRKPPAQPPPIATTPPEPITTVAPLALEKGSSNATSPPVIAVTKASETSTTAAPSATNSEKQPERVEKQPDLQGVHDLITANLSFPARARKLGLSGKLVVAFDLAADGEVSNIEMRVGSGHEILDDSVIATIRRLSPFPKSQAPARLEIPIHFNLR